MSPEFGDDLRAAEEEEEQCYLSDAIELHWTAQPLPARNMLEYAAFLSAPERFRLAALNNDGGIFFAPLLGARTGRRSQPYAGAVGTGGQGELSSPTESPTSARAQDLLATLLLC